MYISVIYILCFIISTLPWIKAVFTRLSMGTISMLIKTSYTCTNDMHLLNEIDSVSTEIYSPG